MGLSFVSFVSSEQRTGKWVCPATCLHSSVHTPQAYRRKGSYAAAWLPGEGSIREVRAIFFQNRVGLALQLESI